ncbi:MAG: LysR family transcriptional regulator [Erysipelotrichaceae bacterium]
MTLRHLKIFKTVCEEGNITKAAQHLYMAQPAVSLAIRELEEHYGICLFDRIARKLYLTKSGEIFLQKARKILALYEEMEQEAKTWDGFIEIKIGSSITIGTCLLPSILHDYIETYHNPYQVYIDNAKQVEKLLMENKVDIALIEGVVSNVNLTTIPFTTNELLICVASNHPLLKKNKLKLADIINQDFYLRENGSATRDVFDSALLAHNIKITPKLTSVNSQSLIEIIKINQGISVLPYSLIENEIKNGSLSVLKINDINLKQYYQIVYHKDKYLNATIENFINLIKQKYNLNDLT